MILLIEQLELEIIIGILPIEREKAQKIIIDAELEYDYQGEYLNYVEIVELFSFELEQNQYGLLEEALQDLSHKLKQKFSQLKKISLSIKKPHILSNCIVGAKINS
ncbi:dihydroneopterin aldolase [Helicobacter kayseriensis]|uniref:dihydroneopterin aldolase n=1 Tax=Helicobacter kayseriensis TaxID=2905877 RepID=UPI001E4ED90F|nr:dihydroneopterin aldolase [Helicobacter kayseriensis]MCE3047144.1 dihydroneopterin aldolase [Helicobacter kayseriensis]MCE3048515.1 dihydroneopterin aldolase [Helicobacter kayseriensis]